MKRFFFAGVGFVLVIGLLGVPGIGVAQTASVTGETGPTAPGVSVDPRQLPPRGETPESVRPIPRRFPVDEATFGQLKARANANAAAAGHLPGGSSIQTAPAGQFPTLDLTSGGGWNPPDAGLAVSSTTILVAVNEAFALYATGGGAAVAGPTGLPAFFGTADSVFDPR